MKSCYLLFLFTIFLNIPGFAQTNPSTLSSGEQPRMAVDSKGVIRMVFGKDDKIFCSTSSDQGKSFSAPVLVAQVPGMHLGMSRGPQIASSKDLTMITAMDKSGNIHYFLLEHEAGNWKKAGTVNDKAGSAPEGLMGLAADQNDHFYAVWQDIRKGAHNQIYFSSFTGRDGQWAPNRLIYESPDGHVCECCKPNVTVNGSKVAVMFRNWLNGSRDLYLLQSANAGKTFGAASKLGMNTWKLNGCPMDGGGLVIDKRGKVHTAWQREGEVYYCEADTKEIKVGSGRTVSISLTASGPVIMYQNASGLHLYLANSRQTRELGKGAFLNAVTTSDGRSLCAWENDKQILFSRL